MKHIVLHPSQQFAVGRSGPSSNATRLISPILLCALLGTLTGTSSAQTTNQPAASVEDQKSPAPAELKTDETKADDENSPITLSLFEVKAERDTGYQANGTLAGTRLRTDLRDTAASVSVVTKDMMNDLGANNLNSVLNYTVGTEVAGLGGNFSAAQNTGTFVDFDSVNRSPTTATRFRALSVADQTRDFFLTDIPLDGYNTERIELNRGANSMLFGLGSPAGVINSTLIESGFDRDRSKFEVKFGSFGTTRQSLDHNQVLIPDKLALRVALLHNDEKFQQEHAFVEDERAFGTLTFRPFSHTKIKVSAEWGKQDSNKPQNRPPMDSFSWWWNIGKPVYDPTTNTPTLLGTAPSNSAISAVTSSGGRNTNILNSQMNSQWTSNIAVILEDPNNAYFGLSGHPGVNAMEARNERGRVSGSSLQTVNMISLQGSRQYLQQLNGGSTAVAYNFWRHQQLSDPSVFDFYNQMIEGPNKAEWAQWRTLNAVLQQQFFDNALGFEVGYDHQTIDFGYYNPYNSTGYTIYIDINTKLANGDPNPNVGRPFIADSGFASSSSSERDAVRASAYYDFDVRKYNKGWLGYLFGHHVLNTNFTSQEVTGETIQGRPTILGLDHYARESATVSFGNLTSETRRALVQAAYIGPSVLGASGPQNTGLTGINVDTGVRDLSSLTALYYQSPATGTPPPPAWSASTFSLLQNEEHDMSTTAYQTNRTRGEFDSIAAVMQSYWLGGHVVSNFGWRSDDYETFEAGNAPFDPATGQRIIDDNYQPLPSLADREQTVAYGVVAHSPRAWTRYLPWDTQVSLIYNRSDNFRPTSQRFTVLGDAIDPQSGETEEYGVLFELLQGKVELRATHYRSASTLATNNNLREIQNGFVREPEFILDNFQTGLNSDPAHAAGKQAFLDWVQTPLAQQFLSTFNYQSNATPTGGLNYTHDDRIGTVVSTSDVVAEGWEFEAVVNPTKNWRIAMNAAKQEAVRSNTADPFRTLLETSILPVWVNGPAGDLLRSNSSTETLRDYARLQYATFQRELQLDGSASPEVRKWRFNLQTNYKWTSGPLKGWNVGLAYRYQDKAVIGYAVTGTSPADAQYDINHPFYGPSLANYDGWIGYGRRLTKKVWWQAQLNVRNIGIGDELIPVSTQPDGSPAAWRIREPMVWSFSNTLSF